MALLTGAAGAGAENANAHAAKTATGTIIGTVEFTIVILRPSSAARNGAKAGYVDLRKAPFEGRQRTWVVSTGTGKRAFKAHVAALQALAGV